MAWPRVSYPSRVHQFSSSLSSVRVFLQSKLVHFFNLQVSSSSVFVKWFIHQSNAAFHLESIPWIVVIIVSSFRSAPRVSSFQLILVHQSHQISSSKVASLSNQSAKRSSSLVLAKSYIGVLAILASSSKVAFSLILFDSFIAHAIALWS